MSKPIVTSSGTGVVKSFYKDTSNTKAYVVVTDDAGGEQSFSYSGFVDSVSFSVGDKVAFTITDGPLGKLPSELRKTS